MSKKPKKKTPDEAGEYLKNIKKAIKDLLKLEKPIPYIAVRIGRNYKFTKGIIERFGLEDNLKKPKLVGV